MATTPRNNERVCDPAPVKKAEQVELLELDKSGIHVAEYLTPPPPQTVLVERLRQAHQRAQADLSRRSLSAIEVNS